MEPLRGTKAVDALQPRVREYATLGFGIKPLRGKWDGFHVGGAKLIAVLDRRHRLGGFVLVLLGVFADEVDEQDVFLLVALSLASDERNWLAKS